MSGGLWPYSLLKARTPRLAVPTRTRGLVVVRATSLEKLPHLGGFANLKS